MSRRTRDIANWKRSRCSRGGERVRQPYPCSTREAQTDERKDHVVKKSTVKSRTKEFHERCPVSMVPEYRVAEMSVAADVAPLPVRSTSRATNQACLASDTGISLVAEGRLLTDPGIWESRTVWGSSWRLIASSMSCVMRGLVATAQVLP